MPHTSSGTHPVELPNTFLAIPTHSYAKQNILKNRLTSILTIINDNSLVKGQNNKQINFFSDLQVRSYLKIPY